MVQNVRIDELGLTSPLLARSWNGDTTEHAIAIEPVAVSPESLICHRISSLQIYCLSASSSGMVPVYEHGVRPSTCYIGAKSPDSYLAVWLTH